MRVLVTGGAGYIGSHTVVRLIERGHTPILIDNFSNSSPEVLKRITDLVGPVICHETDAADRCALQWIFERERPDAVIHFAALKIANDSVAQPLRYYEHNFGALLSVLDAMFTAGCRDLVFSSSAAVYGGDNPPFVESDDELTALSPYGYTKLAGERILTDVAAATNLRVGLLRYFNPVGGHPSGTMGEDPVGPPSNLMPILAEVAAGERERLTVFGADYDTPDGTCIRDYLHVMDLADAHIAALEHLVGSEISSRIWNVGTGKGTSVLELRDAFMRVSGRDIPYVVGERRPGDPVKSWADPTRATAELGWRARRSIDDMCADAWWWKVTNPTGYRKEAR